MEWLNQIWLVANNIVSVGLITLISNWIIAAWKGWKEAKRIKFLNSLSLSIHFSQYALACAETLCDNRNCDPHNYQLSKSIPPFPDMKIRPDAWSFLNNKKLVESCLSFQFRVGEAKSFIKSVSDHEAPDDIRERVNDLLLNFGIMADEIAQELRKIANTKPIPLEWNYRDYLDEIKKQV